MAENYPRERLENEREMVEKIEDVFDDPPFSLLAVEALLLFGLGGGGGSCCSY